MHFGLCSSRIACKWINHLCELNKSLGLCCDMVAAPVVAQLHIPLRMSFLVGLRLCAVSLRRVCGLRTTVNMPKRAKKNEQSVEGEADNGTGTWF